MPIYISIVRISALIDTFAKPQSKRLVNLNSHRAFRLSPWIRTFHHYSLPISVSSSSWSFLAVFQPVALLDFRFQVIPTSFDCSCTEPYGNLLFPVLRPTVHIRDSYNRIGRKLIHWAGFLRPDFERLRFSYASNRALVQPLSVYPINPSANPPLKRSQLPSAYTMRFPLPSSCIAIRSICIWSSICWHIPFLRSPWSLQTEFGLPFPSRVATVDISCFTLMYVPILSGNQYAFDCSTSDVPLFHNSAASISISFRILGFWDDYLVAKVSGNILSLFFTSSFQFSIDCKPSGLTNVIIDAFGCGQ